MDSCRPDDQNPLAPQHDESDLSVLGLSPEAVAVYRFLLGVPAAYPDSVVAALGVEREELDQALDTLHDLQLARYTPDHRLIATEPGIGIERLIERRLAELSDASYRVTAARLAIPALQKAVAGAGASADPAVDIEAVRDLATIRERLDDLAFFARREVCAMQPDGALTPALLEAARPLDMRCLRRGVVMRTIVVMEALEDDLTRAYLSELSRLGARIRVVDHPMNRMLVYDGAIAVTPITPEDTAQGALIVRQAALVATMTTLFEQVWAQAEVLEPGTGRMAAQAPVSSVEKQVLTLLATVDKDEIGARELGVSLRTYRRHVADVLHRLGATSRFQAALLARDRGWL